MQVIIIIIIIWVQAYPFANTLKWNISQDSCRELGWTVPEWIYDETHNKYIFGHAAVNHASHDCCEK